MDLALLLALIPLLQRLAVGKTVERILPVARRGVHVVFAGQREGLRLDTAPGRGAALATRRHPERIWGGRSRWSDLAALADGAWSGRTVHALALDTAGPAVRVSLEGEAALVLSWTRRGAELVAIDPEWGERRLPGGRDAPVDGAWLTDLVPLAEALRRWVQAARKSGEADPADLVALLPALPRGRARAWAADAAAGGTLALSTAEAAAGQAGGFRLEAPDGAGEVPRAADAGAFAVVPGPGAEPLVELVERWYHAELAASSLAERKVSLTQLARAESKRVARALRSLAREEDRGEDPAALRRRADALLAAGPALEERDGFFVVPDVWAEGASLSIAIEPPGQRPHELAERLYRKARKTERGQERRLEREIELGERQERLDGVLARLDAGAGADTEDELTALEAALEELGLAARAVHRQAVARGRGGSRPGEGPRVFRSPAGRSVLVGRSAAENDQITFRVATPDDVWMHVQDYPGAHVLLRLEGGGPPSEAELDFAAGLAAAFSRAPEGEAVDVHVALRKHLRRPKGGAPGQVLVRRGSTRRTRAGRPPR